MSSWSKKPGCDWNLGQMKQEIKCRDREVDKPPGSLYFQNLGVEHPVGKRHHARKEEKARGFPKLHLNSTHIEHAG